MGRVDGQSFTLPGVLFGDGFNCRVQVTFNPYHIEHPAPSHDDGDASVRGMQRRDTSIILDEDEDAVKELRLAQSSASKERLRLDLDMPEDRIGDLHRTSDCQLVRSEGYRRWKVLLTSRQP